MFDLRYGPLKEPSATMNGKKIIRQTGSRVAAGTFVGSGSENWHRRDMENRSFNVIDRAGGDASRTTLMDRVPHLSPMWSPARPHAKPRLPPADWSPKILQARPHILSKISTRRVATSTSPLPSTKPSEPNKRRRISNLFASFF